MDAFLSSTVSTALAHWRRRRPRARLRAKLGANDRRREESPGNVQPQSSLLDAISGHASQRSATARTRLTSEGFVGSSPTAPTFSNICRCVSAKVGEPDKSERYLACAGQEVCGRWMPRAKTRCARTLGHGGFRRLRRAPAAAHQADLARRVATGDRYDA